MVYDIEGIVSYNYFQNYLIYVNNFDLSTCINYEDNTLYIIKYNYKLHNTLEYNMVITYMYYKLG